MKVGPLRLVDVPQTRERRTKSRSTRALSHTEVQSALTCQAQHAFGWTGHLSDGDTLRSKRVAAQLSDGRAWGAAVATWHSHPDPVAAPLRAHEKLCETYAADVEEQAKAGVLVAPEVEVRAVERLGAILDHYMATAVRLEGLHALEERVVVPIVSRTGRRGSNRYLFECFIDAVWIDEHGREWLVEFKLHSRLMRVEIIELLRQPRWYAWARQRQTGRQLMGVIFDERLAQAPKEPRLVKGKRKGEGMVPSDAQDQLCTAQAYVACCHQHNREPRPATVAALERQVWQQRSPLLFRPSEIREAGEELVSAAKLVRDLDQGDKFPIRNAHGGVCSWCRYLPVCANPHDSLLVDSLFDRTVPKRFRDPEETK